MEGTGTDVMVDMLVNEIRKALEQDLFMVALTTALTLPDICGNAEFPNEKNWKRYISWYDNEITSNKRNGRGTTVEDMPELDGSVVYSLRCSLLHEGNPNINNEQLAKNKIKHIDHFVLTIEHGEGLVVCLDKSKVSRDGTRSYSMSVRGLCYSICDAAERYYKKSKDKFSFNYELVDLDDKMRDLRNFAKLFPPITSAPNIT